VTKICGTKSNFLRGLRINLSANALFRLVWTNIQNLSIAMDGAPEIDEASIDLRIDLVEMSDSVRSWSHRPAAIFGPK
jgi:hypothetical protein